MTRVAKQIPFGFFCFSPVNMIGLFCFFLMIFPSVSNVLLCRWCAISRGTLRSNHFDHWSSLLVTDCTFCIVGQKLHNTWFLLFLGGGRMSSWSGSLISCLCICVLYTYSICCFMMYSCVVLWLRAQGVAWCPFIPSVVQTSRFFCSTQTRKIQRCLFLWEKWGVSSCFFLSSHLRLSF